MHVRKCVFCGKSIEFGKGKMFVRKDGTPLFFCSSKCQRNQLKLRRKPREVKWVQKKEH